MKSNIRRLALGVVAGVLSSGLVAGGCGDDDMSALGDAAVEDGRVESGTPDTGEGDGGAGADGSDAALDGNERDGDAGARQCVLPDAGTPADGGPAPCNTLDPCAAGRRKTKGFPRWQAALIWVTESRLCEVDRRDRARRPIWRVQAAGPGCAKIWGTTSPIRSRIVSAAMRAMTRARRGKIRDRALR